MWRYKKRWIAHFGCDYFKAHIEPIEWGLLSSLSVNSNILYIDDETELNLLSDFSDKWHKYIVMRDKKTGVQLAFFWLWWSLIEWSKEKRYADFFEVTGQWLILRNWPEFYLNLRLILGFQITIFTRIDICLDLIDIKMAYLYDKIIKEADKKHVSKIFFDKKGKEQTVYFWEKSRKKNTYQVIRMYDKKADSKGKKKEWLYPDYDEYKDISRLELEIREDKAKFWTSDKLLDDNYLFSVIIKQFYKFNYQFFWFLKFDDFLQCRKSEDSLYYERKRKIEARNEHQIKYGTSFSSEKERQLWISTFISYGKRLLGDGFSSDELKSWLDIAVDDD